MRYAELWGGEECMFAAKLGVLQGFGTTELDLAYIMDAYRRFGGSLRNVLTFANRLKTANVAEDKISKTPHSATTERRIRIVVEMQSAGQEEASKARGIVFHRSPVGDSYRINFASTYMAQHVINAVQANRIESLNTVVAALSVTGCFQDAYGVLYEEEFHKMIFLQQSRGTPTAVTLLGCFGPSEKNVQSRVAKQDVSFCLERSSVVHFPGKSLANASLNNDDVVLDTYFHPLVSNFPTHDAFMVCPATDFFEPKPTLNAKDEQDTRKDLSERVILVGLQMTVLAACGDPADKPSHPVVGKHLCDQLTDFKGVLSKSHPHVKVLDDIVTIFLSPTETCRKMEFMPVLTQDRSKMRNAIQSFSGMAPQYCAVFEVDTIKKLMESRLTGGV